MAKINMANPQKENGHLDIANELVEVLAKTHIPGNEGMVIWAIWRKTWCWRKKNDWISLGQLQKLTRLNRVAVCRAKKELLLRKIIEEKGKKVGFNKDYEQWVVSKMTLVSKTAMGSVENGNGGSVENDTHKRNYTKETNTKEIMISQNEILKAVEGLTTADKYKPDFKKPLKLKVDKKHWNKGQEFGAMVIRLGYVFLEEYQKKEKKLYLGGNFNVSPIAKAVSKRLDDEATEKDISDSVRRYFQSKKAKELTITLNAAFSDATWLAYQQGKLEIDVSGWTDMKILETFGPEGMKKYNR